MELRRILFLLTGTQGVRLTQAAKKLGVNRQQLLRYALNKVLEDVDAADDWGSDALEGLANDIKQSDYQTLMQAVPSDGKSWQQMKAQMDANVMALEEQGK